MPHCWKSHVTAQITHRHIGMVTETEKAFTRFATTVLLAVEIEPVLCIYITGGDLFTKKSSGRMESPLLRHPEGTGPSLFSAELKSKYMSPVKLPGLPQGEMPRDKSRWFLNRFNGRFPTMYLSYSYNLIATHKILRTPYLRAPLLGG